MVERYKYVIARAANETPNDPQSETYQATLYRQAITGSGVPAGYTAEDLGRRTVRNYVVITKERVAQRIIRCPFLSTANASPAVQDTEHKIDAYYELIHELQEQYPSPEFDIIYGLSNCLEEVKDLNPTVQFPPDVSIDTIEVQRTAI